MIARLLRREQAMSLVEVLVSVGLLTSVVAVLGPVMTSSFQSARVVQNESRAVDEIRIAVARIDRELRSAECIDTPAAGTTGSVLAFSTHAGTGAEYDVTYSVSDGQLTRTVDGNSSTVGEGIVVTSQEFSHTANAGQRDTVQITLNVRFEDDNSPREVLTTVAGRNAWGAC